MAPATKKNTTQIYLVHGNNETEVNNARYELVNELLTPEERDAGLTEIRGAGNTPLALDKAMSEIIGELGTASFIAGSRRVVVVYDLKDFLDAAKSASKGKSKSAGAAKAPPKKDRTAVFVEWMTEVLPTTDNIVIFVCLENDEKGKVVSPESPLYQLAKKHGTLIEKKEKPLNFEFEDFVLSANSTAAVTLLREWIRRSGSDSGARLKIYSTVSQLVELALQAKAVQLAKADGIPESQVLVQHGFPSLARTPAWKTKKVHSFAQRLSMETIRDLIEKLAKLQAFMYPTGEEAYVANWEDYLEVIVIQMTAVRG